MKTEKLKTEILIIGGGTAGCFAALTAAGQPQDGILIVEKAHIKRSGCLAAGVNALNAYITEGNTPEDYVEYARKDAAGIVREDLLLTMARRFNRVAERLEQLGLVIRKNADGAFTARGRWNIKINGENIKPILADAVKTCGNVTVLNHVNITDYIVSENRIFGAAGFSVNEKKAYVIEADAVICTTGGAAGLYRPNNPGFSKHKMWYPPFNTGAGYAMGILAGAEMTTMEMRFVALRCKDTIAPTGTIAQGAGSKQVNALGEIYENRYGLTTPERMYGTRRECEEGRGPCYLQTEGIAKEQDEELFKAYLNMAPGQAFKWLETGRPPSVQNVEIDGTEPYIVGGHTASGYWIDHRRRTTIPGLYAAGDVAGGAPQKYVTGALAEGEIAALSALEDLDSLRKRTREADAFFEKRSGEIVENYESYLGQKGSVYSCEDLEEAMQKAMDQYAGGISANYKYSQKQLDIAAEKINILTDLCEKLCARDMAGLLRVYELKERLVVCKSVIEHMRARKETRWRGFGEYADFPKKSGTWKRYVNSRMEDGKIHIFYRDLIKGGGWET